MSEQDYFTSEAWQRHGSDTDDIAAVIDAYDAPPGDPLNTVSQPRAGMLHLFTPNAPDDAELHAGHFLNLLWAIAMPVQGWQPFRQGATGNLAANAVTMQFPPVRPGWEVKVNRLTLSIGGASAAATAAIYVGPESTLTTPDESYLVDFASALFGNTPSRQTSTPVNPYYLTEGDALTVVVAGAAAGTAACFARIEGVRRQKL